MPTTDEEVWRYSRIDELELDAFPPAAQAARTELPDLATGFVAAVPSATVVATVDGHAVPTEGATVVRGLEVVDIASDEQAGEGLLGSVAGDGHDVFATLNDAFAAAPLLVRVSPGAVIEQPVVIVHHATGAGTASFPRLVVDVGADAQVTIVEVQLSDAGPALVAPAHRARHRARTRARPTSGSSSSRSTRGRSARWWSRSTRARRSAPSQPASAATTRGCAPTAAHRPRRARRPRRRLLRRGRPRCSTSARSRTTSRPTPRATCCSRARSAAAAGASTRA